MGCVVLYFPAGFIESSLPQGKIRVMLHMHFDKSGLPTRQETLPGWIMLIETAEYHLRKDN